MELEIINLESSKQFQVVKMKIEHEREWTFYRRSCAEVLLKISQNSQENTCASETLAQLFSCEFYKKFKNTFFYRAPPLAASVFTTHFSKKKLRQELLL